MCGVVSRGKTTACNRIKITISDGKIGKSGTYFCKISACNVAGIYTTRAKYYLVTRSAHTRLTGAPDKYEYYTDTKELEIRYEQLYKVCSTRPSKLVV